MKVLRVSPMYRCIGLIDADLMDNGTRHPNLTLLKIAGFLRDNGVLFRLITDPNEDISRYTSIYLSKVFSFTKLPDLYLRSVGTEQEAKFHIGGTGFYAVTPKTKRFIEKRAEDMTAIDRDPLLNSFFNKSGGPKITGLDMARQKPYYRLYDSYVQSMIASGKKRSYYKDYLDYSIGFLTRGCFRHCPFCVNRLETKVVPYSRLEWFMDDEKDEKGKYIRPYIYLWDDNFLGADPSVWRPLLHELMQTKRYFQFRQGLDERIIAESPYGEEIAETLSKCRYHGDYIFAFDNWKDREKIVKALKIWKYYNKKETKFYLFCGFRLTATSDELVYKDIWEVFHRIKILMQYGCLGYIMRHENYHNHPLRGMYVQLARWCNQPQFFKKMSFWEFCYRCQTFYEETTLKIKVEKQIKTYAEFKEDYDNGYYNDKRITAPLAAAIAFIDKYKDHKDEILEMMSYRLSDLRDPSLWERK